MNIFVHTTRYLCISCNFLHFQGPIDEEIYKTGANISLFHSNLVHRLCLFFLKLQIMTELDISTTEYPNIFKITGVRRRPKIKKIKKIWNSSKLHQNLITGDIQLKFLPLCYSVSILSFAIKKYELNISQYLQITAENLHKFAKYQNCSNIIFFQIPPKFNDCWYSIQIFTIVSFCICSVSCNTKRWIKYITISTNHCWKFA